MPINVKNQASQRQYTIVKELHGEAIEAVFRAAGRLFTCQFLTVGPAVQEAKDCIKHAAFSPRSTL